METIGSKGFKVLQFLPKSGNACWDVVRFEGELSRASYINSQKRSDLTNGAELRVGYEWYGKVSSKVDISSNYFVGDSYLGFQNRGWFFTTLELFLTDEEGEATSPFDVKYAFDRAHPLNPEQRQLVDLTRIQAELEAREAAQRQRDNFAEVDELRTLGAQIMPTNQRWAAVYFREADALRRRIQAKLDNGQKVVAREGVVVPAPAEEVPEFRFSFEGVNAWDGQIGVGVPRGRGLPRWDDTQKPKSLPKVEILVNERRRIVFEEGEN